MNVFLIILGLMGFGWVMYTIGWSMGTNKSLTKILKQLKQPPPCDFGQEDERVASSGR